jgi:MFS family permease
VSAPGAAPRGSLAQTRPWFTVTLFLACFTLAYVDRNITSVMVEPLKASLRLTDTQIGFIQGFAFSLCFAFAGPAIAWLIDRGPRMRIAAIAIAAWSAATMLCGVARSFPMLVAGRALTAASEAGLPPSVYSMITDMLPRNQVARASALFLLAPVLGLGIAFFGGGHLLALFTRAGGLDAPLLGHFSPWQAVFVTIGAPGLLFALTLALLREPARREAPAGSSGLPSAWQVLAPQAGVIVPFVLGTASLMTAFFAHTAWAVSVLARNHAIAPHEGGPLMGLLTFSFGVCGGAVSSWLAGRGSPEGTIGRVLKIIIAGGALMAAAALALPFVGAGRAPAAILGLFLFASTACTVVLAVPIQLSFPGHLRARAITTVGLFYAVGSAGVGPWLAGFVSDHLLGGERMLGWAVSGVSVAAAAIALPLLTISLLRWRAAPAQAG